MTTLYNSKEIQIITTQDGSHSLFNPELNETYHSIHGAIQESNHVFIKNGLEFFLANSNDEPVNVLEIGFGTGLNVLLTLQKSTQLKNKINYTTLEAFPLAKDVWSKLNYINSIGLKDYFTLLHESAWNEWMPITDKFDFLKLKLKLEEVTLEANHYNVIYFDAFAPNKQPELWQPFILKKVTDYLKPNGIFVTYCAKGQLKRDLKDLGLNIETLPGPPGKKEMIRAVR